MLGDAEAALDLGGTSLGLCCLLAVLGLAPARFACIGETRIELQSTWYLYNSELLVGCLFVSTNLPLSAAVSLAPGLSAAAG